MNAPPDKNPNRPVLGLDPAPPAHCVNPLNQLPAGASEATRLKVVVVDDDPIMLGLLQRYLSRAGYEAMTANDAEQGLRLAVEHRPAVIVLDVMMPEMSGLAALRALRHMELTRETPVIVISANDHLEAKQEAQAAGVLAFLVKPFGLHVILEQVNRAVYGLAGELESGQCQVAPAHATHQGRGIGPSAAQ